MSLEVGKVYDLDGRPFRCELVNVSRALLVPAWKESVTIVDRYLRERSFEFYPGKGISVSPNSVLSEWDS